MISQEHIDRAEANIRLDTGIVWDMHAGSPPAFGGSGVPSMPEQCQVEARHAETGHPTRHARRTDGAAYVHDGTLEGMLSAIFWALLARDSVADIVDERNHQPRLGQETVPVETDMDAALKVRRCLEYAHGAQAFHCVRSASAADDSDKGTIIYRFVEHALAVSERRECFTCPRKGTCVQACNAPSYARLIDDLSSKAVFDVMKLYRAVANERHKMVQFIRFEHREGDVWFARCHPNASVVPLLMDWFVPRFNDQRFVLHDESHAISGVYDGNRWYLVGGDAVTPPPRSVEEEGMQRAWRRFYRSVSVEARYHPELRRNFMPMRLWRDLPELGPQV